MPPQGMKEGRNPNDGPAAWAVLPARVLTVVAVRPSAGPMGND